MKHNRDILVVAVQLVRELGDDAVRYCRARLVELIAANHRRGADFWRQVMQACESELAAIRPVPPQVTSLSRDAGGLPLPPMPG